MELITKLLMILLCICQNKSKYIMQLDWKHKLVHYRLKAQIGGLSNADINEMDQPGLTGHPHKPDYFAPATVMGESNPNTEHVQKKSLTQPISVVHYGEGLD